MFMKNMKWYNRLQFTVLCLALALAAVDWGLGLWMSLALVLVSLVKMAAERHVGNPALDTPMRVALLAVVAYWLCLVVSMLWSSDVDRALREIGCEAVLMIAPLCVLLSDMSYIRENHLRTMFYALLLGRVGYDGNVREEQQFVIGRNFSYREVCKHLPLCHNSRYFVQNGLEQDVCTDQSLHQDVGILASYQRHGFLGSAFWQFVIDTDNLCQPLLFHSLQCFLGGRVCRIDGSYVQVFSCLLHQSVHVVKSVDGFHSYRIFMQRYDFFCYQPSFFVKNITTDAWYVF